MSETRIDGATPREIHLAGDEAALEAMAREAQLGRWARENQGRRPRLRLHGWSGPSLTYGRSQTLPDTIADAAQRAGVEPARRPTGGGWLVHLPGDLAVTLAVPGPLGAGEFRAAARRTARLIARGLAAAGRDVDVLTGLVRPASRAEVCFQRADRDELVVGDTKVAGVALARLGRGALVQAAVPLVAAEGPVESFAARADPRRADAVRALAGADRAALVEAIVGEFRRTSFDAAPPRAEEER
jgi:lipoate-protein ligase A